MIRSKTIRIFVALTSIPCLTVAGITHDKVAATVLAVIGGILVGMLV